MKEYIAGLLDGDGSITIRKCARPDMVSPSYAMFTVITSAQKEVLEEIQALYGGSIQLRKAEQISLLYLNKKDLFALVLVALKAKALLVDILPFLRIKVEQAKLAIQFQDGRGRKVRKPLRPEILTKHELIYKKMHQLNTT